MTTGIGEGIAEGTVDEEEGATVRTITNCLKLVHACTPTHTYQDDPLLMCLG